MPPSNTKTNEGGLKSLIHKEDWWAVWIGLGIVIVALILVFARTSLGAINVSFATFTNFADVPAQFLVKNPVTGLPMIGTLILLYAILAALFTVAMSIMGHHAGKFLASFTIIFVLAVIIQLLASWQYLKNVSLEAPVVALIVGLIIGNFVKLPEWFENGMRTEFYVKTGIVLMGATLPFTIILQAGPMALLQASVVAIATFLVIYFFGTKLFGLEKPFAATLGAGGSICGISASIAIGSAVNAKKEHVSISISLVAIWATIMVLVLPVIARALGLSDGSAGALIGTSEFADAAGVAAAAQFGDGAMTTFTLMKIVGRDIYVGIWAFVLAIISAAVWERKKAKNGAATEYTAQKPFAAIIWQKFPKFVLGFFAASIVVTLINIWVPDMVSSIDKNALTPLKNLRTWAFVLCFICIGMTTRFRQLANTGWKPLATFSLGAIINLGLGLLFSAFLFNSYWTAIGG